MFGDGLSVRQSTPYAPDHQGVVHEKLSVIEHPSCLGKELSCILSGVQLEPGRTNQSSGHLKPCTSMETEMSCTAALPGPICRSWWWMVVVVFQSNISAHRFPFMPYIFVWD